jgi:hypothetical protein
MDLLKGEDDFELLYLVTEGTPNNSGGHTSVLNDDRHTTQISRMQFNNNFVATLKQMALI